MAKNIYSFSFKPPKKPHYVAGQFVEMQLPHENKDKRGDKRWFTLSSSPTEDELIITTKILPESGSSYKTALANLNPGQEVNMSSPMGDFVLPKDKSVPLLFIAGGIGCTPFHSICQFVADRGEQRDIALVYVASSPEEIAFKGTFDKLGNKFIEITGERTDAASILQKVGSLNDKTLVYISGPEPFVELLQAGFKELGVNKKRIHTDFFPGYTNL